MKAMKTNQKFHSLLENIFIFTYSIFLKIFNSHLFITFIIFTMTTRNIFLILFAFMFFSCSENEKSSGNASSSRPQDPWVFRSVLDQKTRMITIALNEKLWVAYNTEHGAIYKSWNGIVYFDGAVYSEKHGPQPVTIGDGYAVSKYEKPWIMWQNGKDTTQAIVNYKGHKFVNDHVQLMYEISDSLHSMTILVTEQVEAVVDKKIGLERTFTVTGLKDGYGLGLRTNESSILGKENIVTNGEYKISKSEERTFATDRKCLDVEGVLVLKNGATTYNVAFMETATIKNTNIAGDVQEKDEEGQPYGATLISKSDCKTCHKQKLENRRPSICYDCRKIQQ